jgi:hypothetical protein
MGASVKAKVSFFVDSKPHVKVPYTTAPEKKPAIDNHRALFLRDSSYYSAVPVRKNK